MAVVRDKREARNPEDLKFVNRTGYAHAPAPERPESLALPTGMAEAMQPRTYGIDDPAHGVLSRVPAVLTRMLPRSLVQGDFVQRLWRHWARPAVYH